MLSTVQYELHQEREEAVPPALRYYVESMLSMLTSIHTYKTTETVPRHGCTMRYKTVSVVQVLKNAAEFAKLDLGFSRGSVHGS